MSARSLEGDSGNLVEAARYALLRRLAPAIRHRMVGALHPIELIAEAIELGLHTAAPDLANVRKQVAKVKNLSYSAIVKCTDLTGWLAPEEGAVTMLEEGIDECLAMVEADFNMRGFTVLDEAQEIGVDVSRAAVRTVLTATLIAVVDSAPGPAELILTAELVPGHVALSILVRPSAGTAGVTDATYRRLDWRDVAALAQAESVDVLHQDDRVTMRYPVAT